MPGHETVFISYRREDSAVQADQLRHSLATLLHQETVFFDQAMRPGTDFPNEIAVAIGRAKAVLMVIGPGWVDDMKARESNPVRTDWVLEEVQAALVRRGSNDKFLVIPMLLPGATMPAQDEPKLPATLRELWRVNAMFLKAQSRAVASSSEDYALLALLYAAGVRPFMGTEATDALRELGKRVGWLLNQAHMQPISTKWSDPPITPSLGTDIPKSIANLAKALKACANTPGAIKKQNKPAVRATCQSLLTLLCNMASDLALSKQWHESAGSWVVPASHVGLAVGVAAARLNAMDAVGQNSEQSRRPPPVLLTEAAEQHPTFANVLEIGVSGVGPDQTAEIHKIAWHALLPTLKQDYPGLNEGALVPDSKEFNDLKGAVRIAIESEEPVLLTQKHDTVAPSCLPAREAAAQLGMTYLAYGPEGIDLTRFPPGEVNAARLKCQNAINDFLAP